MTAAEKIQFNLMKIIFKEGDVKVLEQIYKFVNAAITTKEIAITEEIPAFMKGVRATRSNISLEQMQKEQNYKPMTFEEFRAIADEIEWEESLEELLEAIK